MSLRPSPTLDPVKLLCIHLTNSIFSFLKPLSTGLDYNYRRENIFFFFTLTCLQIPVGHGLPLGTGIHESDVVPLKNCSHGELASFLQHLWHDMWSEEGNCQGNF